VGRLRHRCRRRHSRFAFDPPVVWTALALLPHPKQAEPNPLPWREAVVYVNLINLAFPLLQTTVADSVEAWRQQIHTVLLSRAGPVMFQQVAPNLQGGHGL
jgi:hypothetical protein